MEGGLRLILAASAGSVRYLPIRNRKHLEKEGEAILRLVHLRLNAR